MNGDGLTRIRVNPRVSLLAVSDPAQVIDRLPRAMSDHHLRPPLDCFAPDYRGEQPAYPDRDFQARETT